MNLGNLSRKQIGAIIGLVVLILGIGAGVFLVMSGGLSLISNAGPTSTPRQVTISNIDSDTFTVSWISDTSVSGFVKYGTEANKLNQTLSDDRDQLSGNTGLTTTHFVTLKGLSPNTTYYFELGSGAQTYDNNGTPYQIKTPAITTKPTTDVISGKVLLANGQPAPGAIVYVNIEGGATRSAQTRTSGVWTLPLSTTRTENLSAYTTYDPVSAQLNIFVQAADLGTATAIVTTANDNPVPDITLGESIQLIATASAALPTNTIEIENNTVSPKELIVDVGATVTVLNKDGVNHAITAVTGEFDTGSIGGGGNGSFTAPTTSGSYTFFDNLNADVESLRGTLIVQTSEETTTVATVSGEGFGNLTSLPEINEAYEATLSVKLATPIDQGENIATSTPEFKVSGPVGQKVTITVRSDPQTQEYTIDADGEVEFTPPEGLEPGEHSLEIEYVDQNGVLQKITRTFVVMGAETTTGQGGLPSFTSTPSATIAPSPTSTTSATPSATPTATGSGTMPSTSSGVPESGIFTLTLAIFMAGLGLFVGGLLWQMKLAKVK